MHSHAACLMHACNLWNERRAPTSLFVARRYCFYLFFQLKTHRDSMGESADGDGGGAQADGDGDAGDGPALSLLGALSVLTGITALVAVASECAQGQ